MLAGDAAKHGMDPNKAYRGFGGGALILPFLEEGSLHERIDFNLGATAWPSFPPSQNANELLLTSIRLPKFLCPSDVRSPNDNRQVANAKLCVLNHAPLENVASISRIG
jgi:hypothetical protein